MVFGVKLEVAAGTRATSRSTHDPVESMKAVLLPAITLAIGVAAPILRILRASLAEVGSAPLHPDGRGQGAARGARSWSGTCSRTRRSRR